MKLDVRTVAILRDVTSGHLLLLKRSATKKLFPNLITGLGGKVELEESEGENLEGAMLRELAEEVPQIGQGEIADLRLRLVTHQTRPNETVVLLWFTAELAHGDFELGCSEGELIWCDPAALPLPDMVPTARESIGFVAALRAEDTAIYDGIYETGSGRLIVAHR